jgi:hypothetical protein
VRDAVLARRDAAIDPLLRVMDRQRSTQDGSDQWSAAHAVRLLVELGATQAITPMLNILCSGTADPSVVTAIQTWLPQLGPPVRDGMLEI